MGKISIGFPGAGGKPLLKLGPMTSAGFLKGAATAHVGVILTAAAVLGGGCAKPSCEETLTCPRTSGGTAGVGAGAAAGGGGTAGSTAGGGAGTTSASGGTAGEAKGGRGGSGGSDGGTDAGRSGSTSGASGGDAGTAGDRPGVGGTAGGSSGSQNGGAAGDEGDACEGVTCENGGTCKMSGASFKCECAPQYEGKFCERGVPDDHDITPPEVLTISPADLAKGVKSNAQIKITFSEAMNTSSVTDALEVTGFEGDLVATWDATATMLTLSPSGGLKYATGSTPAGTPATTYVVKVSSKAQDLAGNPLPAFSSSFSTLRRISQSIPSGTVAKYSDYGQGLGDDPEFCPDAEPIQVYKWSSVASSGTYYAFAAFDTTVMGATASELTVESATLIASQSEPTGAFYPAHRVILRKIQYQVIDNSVLSATATDYFGVFASSALAQPSMDVQEQLIADLAAGNRQELFRLEPDDTKADGTRSNFACGGFALNVVYLTP